MIAIDTIDTIDSTIGRKQENLVVIGGYISFQVDVSDHPSTLQPEN